MTIPNNEVFSVDKAGLVRRLKLHLPPHCLLVDEEDLRPYECDGLTAYRELPLAVCLPENEGQVIDVLRACHQLGVPVVARGAGTGLSGGAMPHAQGVVLSLARFNRILRVDPLARLAVVQPGVRNLAVSEAAAPHGLYYAPDPSSQIACTLGGNVAENSGGVHCLKYGLTVHNVLRIRVVSIEGEVFEIGSEAPDAPGYDLLALLIGSEGMLGIVTEVTVKLIPKPATARVIMASFGDVVTGGNAVANVIRSLWTYTVIFCGHFTTDVQTFPKSVLKNDSRAHWYVRQIAGSSNLSGGFLLNVMTGNLSHQIEHHLFPDLPARRYAELAVQVREIAQRYGQTYNSGSFAGQLATVLRRIWRYRLPPQAALQP